jgi:hypothetical protein
MPGARQPSRASLAWRSAVGERAPPDDSHAIDRLADTIYRLADTWKRLRTERPEPDSNARPTA